MAVEIKATYKKGDVTKEFAVAYDFGANLEEAAQKFGADVVYNNFVRSGKITIQAAIRRWAEAGLDEATIAQKVGTLVLGVAAERVVDPVSAIKSRFTNMSPEEQLALIKELRDMKK
jgi:hypothetical protein